MKLPWWIAVVAVVSFGLGSAYGLVASGLARDWLALDQRRAEIDAREHDLVEAIREIAGVASIVEESVAGYRDAIAASQSTAAVSVEWARSAERRAVRVDRDREQELLSRLDTLAGRLLRELAWLNQPPGPILLPRSAVPPGTIPGGAR